MLHFCGFLCHQNFPFISFFDWAAELMNRAFLTRVAYVTIWWSVKQSLRQQFTNTWIDYSNILFCRLYGGMKRHYTWNNSLWHLMVSSAPWSSANRAWCSQKEKTSTSWWKACCAKKDPMSTNLTDLKNCSICVIA